MGINNILKTGLFADEYKKWYGRTAQQTSFPAFKTFWKEQVCLTKRTTKTACQMGFGMNKEYDESCQMMVQAHLAHQTVMRNMSNNSS